MWGLNPNQCAFGETALLPQREELGANLGALKPTCRGHCGARRLWIPHITLAPTLGPAPGCCVFFLPQTHMQLSSTDGPQLLGCFATCAPVPAGLRPYLGRPFASDGLRWDTGPSLYVQMGPITPITLQAHRLRLSAALPAFTRTPGSTLLLVSPGSTFLRNHLPRNPGVRVCFWDPCL